MYKGDRVFGAALGRKETYGPTKGISNYGLLPVDYKDADNRKLRKNAGIASGTARNYIKKGAEKNAGYYLGLALGGLGAAAKYSGIEGLESIGDALIGGSLFTMGSQFLYNVRKGIERRFEKEKMKMQREMREDQKKTMEIQREIRDLMKKLVRTPVNGDIHEKIGYKGELEALLNTLDNSEEMGPEQIEWIRRERVEPVKEGMEKYYRIQQG